MPDHGMQLIKDYARKSSGGIASATCNTCAHRLPRYLYSNPLS
jgi:hypothetical protein